MIRAEIFHREFNGAFAPAATGAGLARRGRTGAKWQGHGLEFDFRVNPKVAGLPDCPGEFWPVIAWNGDDTVSYYQYEPALGAAQALRRTVLEKPALGACPYLGTLRAGLEIPLRPNHPHVALYYVDEDDARAWGSWFAGSIGPWLRRFEASPETLEPWCWRVLWDEKTGHVSQVKMLHESVKRGDLAAMQTLLRADRALANARSLTDKRGTFPLHLAAEFGQAQAARVLLEHGADPALLDLENEASALCWAAFFGRPEVVQVLVENGSNPNLRNKHGLTPLGCAIGGIAGRWQQFSNASTEDWRKITETLRARGGVE